MKTFIYLGILLICVINVRTLETSWKSLVERLHEKIQEIYQSEKEIKVSSGKYFKYTVPGDFGEFEVFDATTKKLPNWLTYNADTNEIHGIPTDNDLKKSISLEIRKKDESAATGFTDGSTFVILSAKSRYIPFDCQYEQTTVASVIFHTKIENFNADYRIEFLRNFASFMGLSINDLYLYNGNKMDTDLNSLNLRKAGPGDKVHGKQPGVTVSWKVTCGRDIIGNPQLHKLGELSVSEDFQSVLHQPVLGWFVTSTKSRSKRAAVVGGNTPAAGQTPTNGGTPSIAPSTTVRVLSTGVVKPTPTKSSSVMVKTSIPVTMPPMVTTTTEPRTTTEEPETTTAIPSSTKKTPSTPKVVVNSPPELRKSLGTIIVYAGQARIVNLPPLMFYDKEGDDLKITFDYLPNGQVGQKQSVPKDHWIVYNNRNLYIMPPYDLLKKEKSSSKTMQFVLTATDPKGAFVNDQFKLKVNQDTNDYNVMYNATLDLEFSEYNNSVEKRVNLVVALAESMRGDYDNFDYRSLSALTFTPGSVVVEWAVDDPEIRECNNVKSQAYETRIMSPEFQNAMARRNLFIKDVGVTNISECLVGPTTGTGDDSGLWERILIPVIVIVIILLIIALILCCVYKKKNKYKPANADEDYLGKQNGKKPIIFLEEYEEKQDFVSLQPLILPNEKPPVKQAYEPRADTPEGPSSSTTGSTENEEKELLGSPKDSPRKGFMNAPPPYTSR